jgi:putative FmdB family regulatory protein
VPTYGYRCPSCSTEFEVWQKMSDEAKATCPSCGAEARRLFFPAGIVFKGTGFYATDSRRSSSASSASSSNGTPTKKSADSSAASGSTAKAGDTATTTTSGD